MPRRFAQGSEIAAKRPHLAPGFNLYAWVSVIAGAGGGGGGGGPALGLLSLGIPSPNNNLLVKSKPALCLLREVIIAGGELGFQMDLIGLLCLRSPEIYHRICDFI